MNLATALRSVIDPKRVIDNATALEAAAIDESSLAPVKPDAIVQVQTVAEIQSIIRYCHDHRIPLTVRAAGSALEGSASPCQGGIVLDVSAMNKVLEFWPEDLQVRVEPGIVYEKLNEVLKRESLFFPPSPGGSSDVATIGGMVSTNASGIYSVKYGGTKSFVLELEIVDGTGECHHFGNRAIKRSSGYNLIDLISGSEGTLGVITSVTLQLRGIPEGSRKFAFKFKTEVEAAQAVSEMMRYGLDLAAVEFLDRNVIQALNLLNNYGLEEVPCLFLEIHGPDPVLVSNAESATQIAEELGGQALTLATGQNPWEIRHFVTNAIKLRRPGYTIIRNDAAFPISKLPEIVQFCRQMSEESGLLIHAFGHVGMGLIHALILARRDDAAEWQKGLEVNRRIILKAVECGGTISGEHGIGLGHKSIFSVEHSQSIELMRQIKRVFDPHDILNPGKIFDLS
jgi:D-lactate dehydrogenase (cytochrome)